MPETMSTELLAQATRGPQVETLGDAFAKARSNQLSLANAMSNQQLARQALAEGELNLAKQRRAEADDNAFRQAMSANTTVGEDGTPKVDHSRAIAQLYATGHPQQAIQYQTSVAAQQKAQNEADSEKLKLTVSRAGRKGEIAQAIEDAAPEQRNELYQRAKQSFVHEGLMSPDEVAQLPPIYTPDLDPHLRQFITESFSSKDFHAAKLAETTQADTHKKTESELKDADQKRAENWRIQAANAGSLAANQQQLDTIRQQLTAQGAPPEALRTIPAMWSPAAIEQLRLSAMPADKRAELDAQRKRDEETAKNNAVLRQQGAQRIGLEGQRVAIEQGNQQMQQRVQDPYGYLGVNKNPIKGGELHGIEFLGTLPPAMAARVKAVAEGRETMTAKDKATPQGKAIMDAVYPYDPGFSEQRAQIRKAFTTGPDGRNIGNLNTAPVHLDALAQAADAMNNGSFVPGNKAWNTVSAMFGGAAPNNFEGMKTVVAGEMASAMKGNATDPEIASFNHAVQAASSPAQLAGVIKSAFLPALATKLNTYTERYRQQSPDDTTWSPVLPSARAVFQRYGVDSGAAPAPAAKPAAPAAAKPAAPAAGGTVTVTDPRGVAHVFPDQEKADAFKKAAGIQ